MVLRIVPAQADWLEAAIDALNESLPPLTSFILPGGSEAAARVHVARAAVRRAERAMTALAGLTPVNPAALAYVNRLVRLPLRPRAGDQQHCRRRRAVDAWRE